MLPAVEIFLVTGREIARPTGRGTGLAGKVGSARLCITERLPDDAPNIIQFDPDILV